MTTYFITRHEGAVAWARRRGIEAEHTEHLDVETIEPGDCVLGTLPVSVVAEVCARGGRYFHLEINTPPEHRGSELTPRDMDSFGAELLEYEAKRVRDRG